jgi:hypothetical protein
MNMNYDKIEEPSMDAVYDDEILDAGWNPAIGSAPQEQQAHTSDNQQTSMPPDLRTEVVDLFRRKVYSMQRQKKTAKAGFLLGGCSTYKRITSFGNLYTKLFVLNSCHAKLLSFYLLVSPRLAAQ